MGRITKILHVLGKIAFVINILLLIFASINNLFDLKILSLINMIFLSFTLLYEEKS